MRGIDGVDVDLKSQTIKVTYDPALQQPRDIKGKIAGMGYEVLQ
jgi:copper chaperone CopZ